MNKCFSKNKIYLSVILLLFFTMSFGYALVGSELGVNNNIKITGYKSKKIYDYMKINAYADNISSPNVSSSSGISFSSAGSGTNGQGIYMMASTSNDTYPIYYYRGPVEDNYVRLGNFCWKIIRTTSTGGIKILYNGVYNESTGCSNSNTNAQIGTSAFNNVTDSSLADVGYMYGTRDLATSTSMTGKKYTYGNDVTYSNGTYTLVDTKTPTLGYTTSYTTLRDGYHYTCMSTSTSCSSVYYIYNFGISTAYHVVLSNGRLLSDVLESSLTNSSNTLSSTIKTVLDNWYLSNLSNYESYLEDTSFCNDRSIYQLNGWDKDSNSITDFYFNGYSRNFLLYKPSVTCNNNDSFTKSSSLGNGKLTYPVGLITADEIILGSGTNSSYLYSGSSYWTMTPAYFGDSTTGAHNYVFNAGILEALSKVSTEYGVRPVVSLKSGIEYITGDGTATNPYYVG